MDFSKAILIAVAKADLIICHVHTAVKTIFPVVAPFAIFAIISHRVRARKE